jgi:alpha-L-fucosidase
MKHKKFLFCLLSGLITMGVSAKTAPKNHQETPEWFNDAKLGIFIHWGIYAVNGMGGESWPIFNKKISYEGYLKQANEFTAANYNPDEWAKLFKEAGARYAVLTTKHHDGFALWDTKQKTGEKYLSAAKMSPAKRDLIGPFVDALRKENLKVGLYFSHLDWSHPDYRAFAQPNPEKFNEFRDSADGKDHPDMWKNFLQFHRGQLKELCTLYHPDLLWFDGDWERNSEQWKMKELRELLKKWDPGVVLNSRMGGYGDYETPEQGIPVIPPKGHWELCMTINSTWSYKKGVKNYKSTSQLIRILTECTSMGGNLLLNVGPKPDGTIPQEQVDRLKEIGAWLKIYGEAIYETEKGIARIHYGAPSTLSKDRKTLYLFVFDQPINQLLLKGLNNKPKKISLLSTGETLKTDFVGGAAWAHVPPVIFITMPKNLNVGYGTVVKIELNEPISLYTGASSAIEQN